MSGAIASIWHAGVMAGATLLTDPEVKTALGTLALPVYIGFGLIVLGALINFARSHQEKQAD